MNLNRALFDRALSARAFLVLAAASVVSACAAAGADSEPDLGVESGERASALSIPSVTGSLPLCSFIVSCFYVTNTNDSGPGSLRQALLDANASVLPSRVLFDIPGAGPHVIQPISALPVLMGSTTVDGFSEPDALPGTETSNPVLQIVIDGSASVGTWGLNLEGGGNVVRGLVINNFSPGSGVIVNSDGNTVAGNYIGVDATGSIAQPNAQAGVNVNDGSGNVIGGTTPADRNVISGNGVEGVLVFSDGNQLFGNSIGTSYDGSLALGNGQAGVEVYGDDNQVGGTGAGEANLIAHNEGDGITVFSGQRVVLSRNILQANAGLGIDLNADGVTVNDGALDPDAGPNGLQNFPRFNSASLGSDGKVTVDAYLRSAANTLYRVEFYANAQCDPSGRGEAERFLGSRAVRTDAGGVININWKLPSIVAQNEYLSALAVNIDDASVDVGSTSELGPCLQVP